MLSIKKAKEILFKNVELNGVIKKEVQHCYGFVSAENIFSPVNIPYFNQSSVDGFAVNFESGFLDNNKFSFSLSGEIKAGDKPVKKLKNNSAVFIYTGAAVPLNATCVVMQEKAEVKNECVIISATDLSAERNIRLKGSQIRKSKSALLKGQLLNPASVGFLCSMGLNQIKVFRKPVVSVLSTGNELQKPGEKLSAGNIYESNSYMLSAALKQCGFDSAELCSAKDSKAEILNSVKKLLGKSDVVVITGGISTGKYDLVKELLFKTGVREIFYKVSQKPGKPLFAGIYKNKLVFALPGNPAAALVCFYEYVLPSLRKMSGFKKYELMKVMLPLADSYEVKGDRDLFLKANAENGEVKILEGQGSDILKSFSEANALVYLSCQNRRINKGSPVETHLLPL
jgi:molybdopterin molybdotransferase